MFSKIFFIVATLVGCESVYIYSSFWAPLFNPRILNYRVDVNFDPDTGRNNRQEYEKNYGYRGEKLIVNLGNGIPPDSKQIKDKNDIKFHYTYKDAQDKRVSTEIKR